MVIIALEIIFGGKMIDLYQDLEKLYHLNILKNLFFYYQFIYKYCM